MVKDNIVSKFEGMGVDEIPVSIKISNKGREYRAGKIVRMHDKNYKR